MWRLCIARRLQLHWERATKAIHQIARGRLIERALAGKLAWGRPGTLASNNIPVILSPQSTSKAMAFCNGSSHNRRLNNSTAYIKLVYTAFCNCNEHADNNFKTKCETRLSGTQTFETPNSFTPHSSTVAIKNATIYTKFVDATFINNGCHISRATQHNW